MNFKNKTVFISGASRGIGKAIALKLAEKGANIIIAAKTIIKHPRLEGTIFTAQKEIEDAGGNALPVQCDIRHEEQVQEAVEKGAQHFGGIDILINNASAISLTNVQHTKPKVFDLMHGINIRGTFLVCKYCIPYLKKGNNPHILSMAPPINLNERWLTGHSAYTVSKYGMSMITIGLAGELKQDRVAANTLWPRTTIATAAVNNLLGGESLMRKSRTPEIVADAALAILSKPSDECTGNNFIDENVLRSEGVTDFEKYAVDLSKDLFTDLFLD